MSVPLLLHSVSTTTTNPFLAIVSGDLFMDLKLANELNVTYHQFSVPSDPKYGEIIDQWLESEGIDPQAPVSAADYTLKQYPDVHVRHDYDYGVILASTGPHSFLLY
ncbi:hypothetical protein [Acetobacter indonesiensis]